jgi:uncharacterized protein (UPF0332 family)
MEKVALSLQRTAVELRAQADDFDSFGRSAFNRYYYAAFLEIRSLIKEFNPNWRAGHSTVPDVLKGSIEREIKIFRKKMLRGKDYDTIKVCDRAVASIAALSEMMNNAYAVRVTADYNPEIKINDEGTSRFSLGSTNITDAHRWLEEAKLHTNYIRRAWRLARGIS